MRPDPILIAAIALAEDEAGAEVAITLVTGGFLISGFVTSFEKYMKHDPIVEGVANALAKIAAVGNLENEKQPDASGRTYIHLRDAKYFTPGGPPVPGNAGVFCRIRLDAIVGFHIGKLQLDQ